MSGKMTICTKCLQFQNLIKEARTKSVKWPDHIERIEKSAPLHQCDMSTGDNQPGQRIDCWNH